MITKSQDVVLSRDIDLGVTLHQGNGADSVLLSFQTANNGFSTLIHLSVSDTRNIRNILNTMLGEEE